MLDLFNSVNFYTSRYFAVATLAFSTIGASVSFASMYPNNISHPKNNHEFEWVTRYFNALDQDTTIDEVVDFIVNLRDALEAKGYTVPCLGEFCLRIREDLTEKGIQFDEDIVDEICEKIMERDSYYLNVEAINITANNMINSGFLNVKSSHKKNKDKVKMSEGTAKGFMKAFAGALLCIIPHPATWAIGSGLIASGVSDMVKHAGGSDSTEGESAEERIKNFPPPPERENLN